MNAKQKRTSCFVHLVMGTPASCSANDPAQTVAIDELPLLSVMVDSSLTVNGKSS